MDVDMAAFRTSHHSLDDHLVSTTTYDSTVLTHHFIPETAPGVSTALWDICFAKNTKRGDISIEENIMYDEAITDLSNAAWAEVQRGFGPGIALLPGLLRSTNNGINPLLKTVLEPAKRYAIEGSALWERFQTCYRQTSIKIRSLNHMRHMDIMSDGRTVDWEIEDSYCHNAVSMLAKGSLKKDFPDISFKLLMSDYIWIHGKFPSSDNDTKRRTKEGWASLMERTHGYSHFPEPGCTTDL